jgi:biopolymer transport protein ExbD
MADEQAPPEAEAVEPLSPRLKAKKTYRRLKRGVPTGEDVAYLNITAMMDMMTIILVFFLKSFASSVENIPVGEDLMPPKSNSEVKPHQAVQITLTKKAILVEDDAIAAVKRGAVDSSIKKDGQSGYQINPLFAALQKHATRLKKIEKMTGGKMKFAGEIVLIADHSTPYRLISEVLYTAGQAEYSKYRLLVQKSGP